MDSIIYRENYTDGKFIYFTIRHTERVLRDMDNGYTVLLLYMQLWQNQVGANLCVRLHIAYYSQLPKGTLHVRFTSQTRFAVLCELWPPGKWEKKISTYHPSMTVGISPWFNECQLLVSFMISILLNQGLPQTLQRRKYGKLKVT